MAFTAIRSNASDAIWKKQARFDDVLVFDEEFNSILRAQQNPSQKQNKVWLTFVDFAPTYKYHQEKNCMKMSTYEDVMDKANQWFAKYSTANWSVLSCETLYAKMLINFAESGDIKAKRVAQISKWPLQDESFLNAFDPNQSIGQQHIHLVFEGKYIVQLLRVWLQHNKLTTRGLIEHKLGSTRPPRIAFKDYWPKMIFAKEGKEFKSNKKVMEKMNEVIDRVNLDIANQETYHGPIICVISYPSYSGGNAAYTSESSLLKSDQVINVVRVFYDSSIDAKQEDLIGFADFIPECISGGGFIKYPKFESQSKLVQKASKWLAQNPEIKLLNSNSVDIKLKAMTSIDSSEMSFTRNTGDFIRILRICYSKPYETDLEEMSENPDSSNSSAPPPPPPIYLNCTNIISLKNSTSELKQKLNDYLAKECWQVETDIRHRWKLLSVDSLTIFQPSSSNNKKSADMWDNSFSAISISSSTMNRTVFDGINLFYDTGYFGKESEDGEAEGTEPGDLIQNNKKVNDKINVIKKDKLTCTII